MRRHLTRTLAICLLLFLVGAIAAHAEDGTTFRRTTPRAPIEVSADEIAFGIPAGRAWGLESRLIPVRGGASVALDLGVEDGLVSEAFVRIAWYDRGEGRPRQMLVEDAPAVLPGVQRRVVMHLEPPDGAVAFRIRVLGRVMPGATSSRAAAIEVGRVRVDPAVRPRPALTRLWAEPP